MAGNPFKRFRGLFPEDTVQIATVQVENSNGTTDVALLGGGTRTVTGTGYTPGGRVFIKSGAIMSTAPALGSVEIEV